MTARSKKKQKRQRGKSPVRFVVVKSSSYGNKLKGTKIYYEGKRPAGLKPDGSIKFGKNILEALGHKYARFRWIITQEENSIRLERRIQRVRTSLKTLTRMYSEQFDRNRDIKNDIVRRVFSEIYPSEFKKKSAPVYVSGTLAGLLGGIILPRLSSEDKDALNKFLPDFISSESVGAVNILKATAQIKTLRELSGDLSESIDASYSESWWQNYIQKNILIIQQGYIRAIEKINISVGNTKFPDFSLVTHDGYLDILEIKKPATNLLKPDESRGNFFWDSEMSKALIQVENYIEGISRHADAVRSYIFDNYDHLDLKVLRPRGIILAGTASQFRNQKEKDDFRLLCQSAKNITIVTYDELLARLQNYIGVLEKHSRVKKAVAKKARPNR